MICSTVYRKYSHSLTYRDALPLAPGSRELVQTSGEAETELRAATHTHSTVSLLLHLFSIMDQNSSTLHLFKQKRILVANVSA